MFFWCPFALSQCHPLIPNATPLTPMSSCWMLCTVTRVPFRNLNEPNPFIIKHTTNHPLCRAAAAILLLLLFLLVVLLICSVAMEDSFLSIRPQIRPWVHFKSSPAHIIMTRIVCSINSSWLNTHTIHPLFYVCVWFYDRTSLLLSGPQEHKPIKGASKKGYKVGHIHTSARVSWAAIKVILKELLISISVVLCCYRISPLTFVLKELKLLENRTRKRRGMSINLIRRERRRKGKFITHHCTITNQRNINT